ncbi:MAG: hypothetical protein F9K18_12920 [Thermoanaerobaculia bacterium]|nr:MAG: hypothetical protein F9K18_12920 [Thermoanaerobaculia bacterium]
MTPRSLSALVAAPILVLLLASELTPSPAAAATVAGVSLPDSIIVGQTPMVLNGADLRSKMFIKVYVGALYLTERNGDAAAVLAADSARRMELRFLRDVSKAQLCDSWKEGLAANTPGAGPELAAKFDRLCAAMMDVREGSRLTLTYRPDAGTQVVFGRATAATIPGKDFADALLACWIGPKPGPGEEFKQKVLGR